MNGLQIVIGVIILIYVISRVVSDYKNFISLNTLRDFLLAPLLSVAFSPFVYLFLLFTQYELLFIRLKLGKEKSKELKKYAKIRIIKYCLLSPKKIRKILKNHDLIYIERKEDIDKIIKGIKNQA